MPNWLRNKLYIHGPHEEIARFKQAVRPTNRRGRLNTDLSLRTLSPLPGQDGTDSAYRQGLARWGTPWDVRARLVGEADEYLDYTFRSACGLPLPWLKAVSTRFPALEFLLRYDDAAARLWGSAMVKGGIGDDVRVRPGRFFFTRTTEKRTI